MRKFIAPKNLCLPEFSEAVGRDREGVLHGDVPMLDSWFWNASFNYGRTEGTTVNEGRFIKSRVEQALGPKDGCTGDCVPLNLFGGEGSISEKMLNYMKI